MELLLKLYGCAFGAVLPEVLDNLHEFRHARWLKNGAGYFDLMLKPQIGIVFVAMKRNIADFPAVLSLADRLGALHFLATNVLPYTPEMQEEILYSHAISDSLYTFAPMLRFLDFPKMDIEPVTRDAIYHAMRGDHALSFAGAVWERAITVALLSKRELWLFVGMATSAHALLLCTITKCIFINVKDPSSAMLLEMC